VSCSSWLLSTNLLESHLDAAQESLADLELEGGLRVELLLLLVIILTYIRKGESRVKGTSDYGSRVESWEQGKTRNKGSRSPLIAS
jgi:hypothetical protein